MGSLITKEPLSNAEHRRLEYIDTALLWCLMGLVVILPVAHTVSIRLFFLLLAALLWAFKLWRNRSRKIFGTPVDLALGLFFLTIIISFFTSLNLSYSAGKLRSEFLTYTLLFYVTAGSVRRQGDTNKLILTLFGGSFIMAVYGMYNAFYVKDVDPLAIAHRMGSLHQGYEAYAQYLIMVLPFNILWLIYPAGGEGWARHRAVLWGLLVLNVSALYLTHTRGAWIAFWVEVLLIIFFAIKKTALKAGLIAAFVALSALFVVSLPSDVLWHGKSGVSLDEKTMMESNTGNTRLVMWKASVEELAKNPFKGAGYGKTMFRWRFKGRAFAGIEQAHNTFVNTAIQLGIQGLLALVFIICVVIRMNWQGFKDARDGFEAMFFLSVMVMTAGFFIANQFAEFYIDDTALLFWLLVGLSAGLYAGRDKGAAS